MNRNLRLRVLPQIPPVNSKQVELRATDTYIQWRYVNDPFPPDDWTDLIALSLLVGPEGPAIQMRVEGDYIQYAVEGSDTWIDLIALSDLVGPPGEPGVPGPPGPGLEDGDKGAIVVSDSGTKWELARDRKTVALLISDTVFSYTEGEGKTLVAPGDIVTAQGFRYEVAASDATDEHVSTSGGVKLYVLPGSVVAPVQFGAVGDGATDDTAALSTMFDAVPADATIDLCGQSFKYTSLTLSKNVTIRNGTLTSDATTGTQISISPSARLTARNVRFLGGGVETTVVSGHYIIAQVGVSHTDRGVGFDIEGCELSGAGLRCIYAKWSDGIRIVGTLIKNFAYAGVQVYSCNSGVVRENRVEGTNAVGSGGNAYGIAITHDSVDYSSDPNAGTPQAINAFGNNWLITGNTVLAPKIWEGIDFHGDYNVVISENRVFGGSAGIKTGASSGNASNYAGYNTIVVNNIVTTRNEDGTPGSPTNLQYGIVAQGGSASSHKRVVISGNIVQGYGNSAATTTSESILINMYAEQFVVTGNVISDWIGIAMSISTGATVGIVNDNVFSSMSGASANSTVLRLEGTNSGRFMVMGNVLETGGNAPTLGLRTTGTVTALITYGSDFRAAGTEVSVAGGTVRQVQYA